MTYKVKETWLAKFFVHKYCGSWKVSILQQQEWLDHDPHEQKKWFDDPHKQKIYEEAFKEGAVEVYRTRIMLVGHFAAGKTSVKRSLLNEGFVEEYLTTDGLETEQTVSVHMSVVKKGEILEWKEGEFTRHTFVCT